MFGQNASNTANQSGEATISASNVGQLAVKWSFTTGGDVSARAAVVDGVAYFPDWGGSLHAVNASNGVPVWSKQLSSYGLATPTHSRTTPAVVNGTLYLGTQQGAWLLAINAKTGALRWKTQLESPASDPFAVITTSPTVVGGTVFTGVASIEEGVAANPAYQCCQARGSVVAVNANTGAIKWQTYMVPAGYTGGGVWGSNPVVDGGTVFVGTGNNYSHPKDDAVSGIPGKTYGQCIAGGDTRATCNAAGNYVDAIVALNVGNGKVQWAKSLTDWNDPYPVPYPIVNGSDDWNVACLVGFAPGQANCPSDAGPDYDFAQAPNLITYQTAKGPKTILGAGQKSGIYFALDPKTGNELWRTRVGPGSALGGMEWGSATDGKRIYVSIANLYGLPYAGGNAGSVAALDPATGNIVWQTADPNGSIIIGPMTVANGIVYASSMAGLPTQPTMLALNATTGAISWSFPAGSSVNAGATVVDGAVYWGSGYAHLGIPGYTANDKFYAFSINGQ